MKRHIPKVCERCGKEFICGLFGCWCNDTPVTDTQYASIVEQYHDCLCPSCLSELTAQQTQLTSLDPIPRSSSTT